MGWMRNLAVKNAIKKSLLDITDRLDRFSDLSSKEKVEMFVSISGLSSELPPCKHWESTFLFLVMMQTRSEFTTLPNFNDYMPVILELTSEWITRVLGGNAGNMHAEIKSLGFDPNV